MKAAQKINHLSKSKITWSDYSWHPVTGCTRVSPACEHCYAETMTGHRLADHERYKGTTKQTPRGPRWTGLLKCHEDVLIQPRITTKPGRVFVAGMSDLFHRNVPTDFIIRVFEAMHEAPHHQYICLTKRPERIAEVEKHPDFPGWAPNIWMGTTIESNDYVERADHLRACGAIVKWISAEPLLGALDRLNLDGIDWVVVAGESGHGARAMDLAWVDDLMARCRDRKIATHIKQMGEHWTRKHKLRGHGTDMSQWLPQYRVREYPSPAATKEVPMDQVDQEICSPDEIDFWIGDTRVIVQGHNLPFAQALGDEALDIPNQMILYGRGYTIIIHDAGQFKP